ncbi:MAG TPA: hypothetical protein VK028_05710 [Micromonosporaceae bacterium]|nr:hypothetical protein [Micromonosporaceae bacterium]
MAYPVVPARPTRPGSVTVAGVLVFAAAAALLAMAVAQFLIIGPVGQAVEEVTTDPAEEGLGTALAAVLFGGGGVLNALVALSLGILAGFDLAGKRAARVMTWIVAPLGLVCCGCLSAVYTEFVFSTAGSGPPTGSQDVTPEQMAAIAEGMPAWYTPVILVAVGVLGLSVLGAVIALAVPQSNEYFRKRPEGWMPAGWPGYPPAPGGYPAPGAYPPAGTYPPSGTYPPAPGGYPGYPPSEPPSGEQRPPQWPSG